MNLLFFLVAAFAALSPRAFAQIPPASDTLQQAVVEAGRLLQARSADPKEIARKIAREHVDSHRAEFGLGEGPLPSVVEAFAPDAERVIVRFEAQRVAGVPVEGTELQVGVEPATRRIIGWMTRGRWIPGLSLDTTPSVPADRAADAACERPLILVALWSGKEFELAIRRDWVHGAPGLLILPPEGQKPARLAWAVPIRQPMGGGAYAPGTVLVDAGSARVVDVRILEAGFVRVK